MKFTDLNLNNYNSHFVLLDSHQLLTTCTSVSCADCLDKVVFSPVLCRVDEIILALEARMSVSSCLELVSWMHLPKNACDLMTLSRLSA